MLHIRHIFLLVPCRLLVELLANTLRRVWGRVLKSRVLIPCAVGNIMSTRRAIIERITIIVGPLPNLIQNLKQQYFVQVPVRAPTSSRLDSRGSARARTI